MDRPMRESVLFIAPVFLTLDVLSYESILHLQVLLTPLCGRQLTRNFPIVLDKGSDVFARFVELSSLSCVLTGTVLSLNVRAIASQCIPPFRATDTGRRISYDGEER